MSLVLAHQNGVSCLSAVRGGVIGVGYWKGYLQRGKFYSWFSYLFLCLNEFSEATFTKSSHIHLWLWSQSLICPAGIGKALHPDSAG